MVRLRPGKAFDGDDESAVGWAPVDFGVQYRRNTASTASCISTVPGDYFLVFFYQ